MKVFFDRLHDEQSALTLSQQQSAQAQAMDLLLGEIRSRLKYLVDVGIGYLNLDRQSRTLSGGEVQRINLTTALGTSLVNTLFVLDEPTLAYTRQTWAASTAPCSICAMRATPWWWSSTTRW